MMLLRKVLATVLMVLSAMKSATTTSAFVMPRIGVRPAPMLVPSARLGTPLLLRLFRKQQRTTTTTTMQLGMVGHHKHHTTIAGKLSPVLKKLVITPAKAKAIWHNMVATSELDDMIVISLLAFGLQPAARFIYQRLASEKQKQRRSFEETKKGRIVKVFSQLAKVSLSVYAVDMLCVILSTLDFAFVNHWHVSNLYAKTAYVSFAVRELLQIKRAALCRVFKVSPDNMGRVDVLDKLSSGVIVGLTSLVLFDWLSVQMNMAFRGIFAFGSVGTLAFTFASQGLLTQLISGVFLTFSNKFYVGDAVEFGDGTSGLVTKQGWMDTVLRTSDNTVVRIPNSVLSQQKVSNVSRVRQCQVKQTLRFHYDDADQLPEILDDIKSEIRKACPQLITDGSRPFRVFWTNYNEDHLEVMVDTHHNLAPIGNPYWENRQAVLMAIDKAVRKNRVEFAQLYSFSTAGSEPEWRAVPRANMAKSPADD